MVSSVAIGSGVAGSDVEDAEDAHAERNMDSRINKENIPRFIPDPRVELLQIAGRNLIHKQVMEFGSRVCSRCSRCAS